MSGSSGQTIEQVHGRPRTHRVGPFTLFGQELLGELGAIIINTPSLYADGQDLHEAIWPGSVTQHR